ncbi:MAG TPA: fatty acid desaturase [Thermoanaerobaculia bacterium]|jgi:fatty acid desaturase|nr:fatty acid desaturase [Thermoanaerobaculia bacterium]
MNRSGFPIPARLNLTIAAVQLCTLCLILWAAGQVHSWGHSWGLIALLSLAYGIAMNSGYAMLHEAEHNLLHPNPKVNQAVGVLLALFFPAPFHLIRQGHIGHHIRNRSDDEAFDLYFEDENRFWKYVQLYGTLTGMFWVLIYLTNFVVLFRPTIITPRYTKFNRPTEAFLESLNPRYRRLIQVEALAVLLVHAAMIYFWKIPFLQYLAVMFGFGFLWSAMQYAHHYGTERDVQKGALNLRTFGLLDLVWLNHNWHLNHHLSPTVPWLYLPVLSGEATAREPRGSLLRAYLREWRGPQLSAEHVENRYAGKVIK